MVATTSLPSANHIQPDENFVTDGVAELPRFLQEKENYSKLVEWYCKRWETLDLEVIRLAYMRLVINAEGAVLDAIGERIGLSRHNQTDTEYKALIRLRAFRQIKKDTRDDIVTLMRILFFGEDPIINKGSNNFVEVIIPDSCLSVADASNQLEDMFPINTNLWVMQTDANPFFLVDGVGGEQDVGTGGLSDSKVNSVESLLTNWIHSSARSVKNT